MQLSGSDSLIMNKLSKEKKLHLALVALVTAGVIAGLWVALLSLQKKKIGDISKKISETQAEIQKVQKVLKDGERVRGDLDEARTNLSAIEATMPSGDLYSWMVSTLRQFNSPDRHVDIPQIGMPGVSEMRMFPNFPYHQATVQLGGTAYYYDFGKFLSDFENRFPYMRVQNLTLEPALGSNPDEREKLAFRIEIVALVRTNSI
jgi:hypothetical protein